MKTRLAVNYQFLSFALTATPQFLPGNQDDDRRGSSQIAGFDANLQFDKWIQALSYRRVRGFYLNKASDFVEDWDPKLDNYIPFPDLHYQNFYGLTGYKFNPDFSLKALSTQPERQRKSSGSLLPMLWYRYFIQDDCADL